MSEISLNIWNTQSEILPLLPSSIAFKISFMFPVSQYQKLSVQKHELKLHVQWGSVVESDTTHNTNEGNETDEIL
jgi:hypothetical protein